MANYQAPAAPRGLLRLGYRLPIALYRARLGWLLGRRFLLLTHRGRKSGMPRHAVLEVVSYDPAMRESAVVCAYGDRADWYQNILASPPIAVQTGRERYIPRFRLRRRDALPRLRLRWHGERAALAGRSGHHGRLSPAGISGALGNSAVSARVASG